MRISDKSMSVFEHLNISSNLSNDGFFVSIEPLEFGDIFKENHDFSMFGKDQFMSFIRGIDLGSMEFG